MQGYSLLHDAVLSGWAHSHRLPGHSRVLCVASLVRGFLHSGRCILSLCPADTRRRDWRRSLQMLDTVAAWAAAHRRPLDWAASAGPQRLTPLHLAAMMPDGGRLAQAMLLRSPAPTARLWFTAAAAGGATPAHFARLAGGRAATRLAAQRLWALAASLRWMHGERKAHPPRFMQAALRIRAQLAAAPYRRCTAICAASATPRASTPVGVHRAELAATAAQPVGAPVRPCLSQALLPRAAKMQA